MIILILLFAFFVRFISLNQSFWLDEATSITIAQQSLSEILQFAKGDFHPPLYYFVLNVWTRLIGSTEISVRMLSVILGIGSIYLVYLIAKRVFNRKTAYLAAALLSIAPLHIYYSQEARMYSQLTFFAALAVYSFIAKKQWLFSIALILLVATDYVGALLIPVFFIYLIINNRGRDIKSLYFSLIPLVLVSFLWLPSFLTQLSGGLEVKVNNPQWWGILGGGSIKQIALFGVKLLIGRIDFASREVYALAVFIPSVIALYFLSRTRKHFKKYSLFVLWFLTPVLLGIVASFFVPIFSYFRFLFVIPAFYLLIAAAYNQKIVFHRLLVSVFILSQLIFSGTYLFDTQFHREDWRGLVGFLNEQEPQGTNVYFVSNSQMEAFKWYSQNTNITSRGPESISDNADRIWVMRYVHDVFDPDGEVIKKVESLGYTRFTEYNFNGVVVRKYEK